jgi:magnesium-transporting ATPase (P-type)
VIFVLGVLLVLVGRPLDALVSLAVIGVNIVVSVVQEVRAKRLLDRIALLTRPTAKLVRDGAERAVGPRSLSLATSCGWRLGTRWSSTAGSQRAAWRRTSRS